MNNTAKQFYCIEEQACRYISVVPESTAEKEGEEAELTITPKVFILNMVGVFMIGLIAALYPVFENIFWNLT